MEGELQALMDAIEQHATLDAWQQRRRSSRLSLQLFGTRSQNEKGDTPLTWAARVGNSEAVAWLIGRGVGVDSSTTAAGGTPLCIACHQSHVECVRLLLGAGASVDLAKTDDGTTPLYVACQGGHVEVIRLLLGAGASVDSATTDIGTTPLFVACFKGHVECVRLLLGAGASVDLTRVDTGTTPLTAAFHRGHAECVQLLSSYGASREALPSEEDMRRRYPERTALIEWLALSRHWTPLHHLEVLSPERARALLRAGANLHLKAKPDVPSPLERAQQLLFAESVSSTSTIVASLVVRAAGPWSAESHELFGDAERAWAATLVRLLYHVYLRRMSNGGWEAVDFARGVLSFAIVRGMPP